MESGQDYLGEGMVFILGVPRSGTTWTWGLLISHPEIEPLLIEDFPNIQSASGIEKMKVGNGFTTSETTIFFSNLDDNSICGAVKRKKEKKPGKILVEKTPSNVLKLDRITRLFPMSQYIVIERDPRAVVSSILNTRFQSGRKIAETVESAINLYHEFYDNYSPYLSSSNFLSIRYEDLSKNPQSTISRIFRFVGVRDSSKETVAHIVEANKGKVLIDQPNIYRRGKIDSYKSELLGSDLKKIETELKQIMIRGRYKTKLSYFIDKLQGDSKR